MVSGAHQPRWTRDARISFSVAHPGKALSQRTAGAVPSSRTLQPACGRWRALQSRGGPVLAGAGRLMDCGHRRLDRGWSPIRPARISVTATPLISWHPRLCRALLPHLPRQQPRLLAGRCPYAIIVIGNRVPRDMRSPHVRFDAAAHGHWPFRHLCPAVHEYPRCCILMRHAF